MKKIIELDLRMDKDVAETSNSMNERNITLKRIEKLEKLKEESWLPDLEMLIITLNSWKNIDEWNEIKLELRDYLKKLLNLIEIPEKCPYRLYACGEFACKLGKGNINPTTNQTYSFNPDFCAGCENYNPGDKK